MQCVVERHSTRVQLSLLESRPNTGNEGDIRHQREAERHPTTGVPCEYRREGCAGQCHREAAVCCTAQLDRRKSECWEMHGVVSPESKRLTSLAFIVC